jgi:hypothetical protein
MNLFQDFASADVEKWQQQVQRELQLQDLQELNYTTADGITLQPYNQELPQEYTQITKVIAAQKKQAGWKNVMYASAQNQQELEKLVTIAEKYKYDKIVIDGAAHSCKSLVPIYFIDSKIKIENDTLVAVIAEKVTSVEQLTQILKIIQDKLNANWSENIVDIVVQLPIYTNYIEEIAKLRALRLLLAKWTEISNKKLNINIRGILSFDNFVANEYKPLIAHTTMAMSAIIGTCNEIAIPPHHYSYQDEQAWRWAKNIAHLLQEEAYLDYTLDPAAGSYTIEQFTWEIAKKSWEKFALL